MTSGGAGRLRVALLQLPAFDLVDHDLAWAELLRRIDEAGERTPDLIVAPEASYPAYYLHSRQHYDETDLLPDDEVLATLAERAARYRSHLAVGLVLHAGRRGDGAALENVVVVFGPEGEERTRYAKRFLWHFDRRWFAPGDDLPLVELRSDEAAEGAVAGGLLICADGRLPELARAAGEAEARLLIEPTAWVSSGRDAGALNNPQAEYLMRARAIEQGAWVLAADKVGVEAGSIVYAGRSGIIDPSGEWVIQAPSDRPGMILHTIDLDAAPGPAVTWQPAIGDAYLEAGPSRVSELAREPLIVEDAAARVAAVALDASPSTVELIELARELVLVAAQQDSALVLLPDLAGTEPRAPTQDELLPLLQSLSSEANILVGVTLAERTNDATYKTLYLLDRGEVIAAHRQTHVIDEEREAGYGAGDRPPPVIETMVGHVGLLAASEGLVPELAGVLKRQGAELLLWSSSERIPAPLALFARTRALEQRCYVLAASGSGPGGGAVIAAPGGVVLGEALAGEAMAVSADINRAFARWNDMAPGTSAIRDHERGAWAGR